MVMQTHIKKVIKRDGSLVDFNQEKITNAIYKAAAACGGHDRAKAEALSDDVVRILNECFPEGATPSIEEIQDIVESTLIKHGHDRTAKAYILYRAERARQRAASGGTRGSQATSDNIPYKVIWRVLNWNVDHNCHTVDALNKHVKDWTFPDLVKAGNEAYEEDVKFAANEILKRKDEIRLVIIAGPSSSGKTTTTIKLNEHLSKEGLKLKAINVDNYFFDLECHPKAEYGDYDFETPEALDLKLIDEHISLLLEGKTVKIPYYDFKTGKRHLNAQDFSLAKDEILLIDTLHGLYNPMTKSIPQNMKFKLYIETLAQLKDKNNKFVRWADIRMLRRMIRDSWHRSYTPEMTVGHWHYVRRSELKHIVPYISEVDYIVNGALPYELPILKSCLFKYFPGIIEKYKNDPKKEDAYIRAKRVYDLLNSIEQVDDFSVIPPDSLLREFIGGSKYKY